MEYVEEEDEEAPATARPRRMSEIRSSIRVKPLPKASSFFIFSYKNRYPSLFTPLFPNSIQRLSRNDLWLDFELSAIGS